MTKAKSSGFGLLRGAISASAPPGTPDAYVLVTQGDANANQGAWQQATADYQQALSITPGNQQALYGLAKCAEVSGDVPAALDYYRAAIYTSAPFPYARKLREPYAFRAMPFALLLNEAGQVVEAVSVYNQVVGLLNHEDGKEHALEADLPEFGDGPGQLPYSPQGLEAMAHLAIGIDTFTHEGYGDPEPLTNFRQAVALAPDSAAANFYLGKYLYGMNNVQAKAFLDRAVRLGDDRTVKAAKKVLQYIH